jgi:hypothetical protein
VLENTEGTIETGQSRETDKKTQDEEKQSKNKLKI